MDLTSGRIAIRHTLVMVDGKPATAEPKTAKGRRSLTLAPEVLEARCVAHRAHQAAERLSWGASTTPIRAWSLLPRTVGRCTQRRCRACSSARPGAQGCRRSDCMICGTRSRRFCWPGGVHPKVVSEMLGHATIALTLDTYSHVIPSLQQEAAGVVAAAVLDPASIPPQAIPERAG